MNSVRGRKNLADGSRPKWEKYISLGAVLITSYFTADLLSNYVRIFMLPNQAPTAQPARPPRLATSDFGSVSSIVTRNIFSSSGQIPDPIQIKNNGPGKEEIPIPSQLPLALVGTLVHSNPLKSIAAIELKGKNQIISLSPKKEIEGMAIIEKIERLRVILRNLNTNHLEFIENKTDNKLSFSSSPSSESGGKDVRPVGDNRFEIKRDNLVKYISDLPSVLMQAQTAPARRPNGDIYGFKLLGMQQGSVFEELGLKVNDVIMGVNGTNVTSAQQAMELYQALRNSNKIKLQVERDGKTVNMDYSVTN